MPEASVKKCDECNSPFFAQTSEMKELCPECAHHLYGYPPCQHVFIKQQCTKCGWDGARSNYLRSLLQSTSNDGKNEK